MVALVAAELACGICTGGLRSKVRVIYMLIRVSRVALGVSRSRGGRATPRVPRAGGGPEGPPSCTEAVYEGAEAM